MTAASFTLILPFLLPFASPTVILDPITRILPFSRDPFEGKAANFWCFLNVVSKWRTISSPGTLVKLSALLTTVGFVPAVVGLLGTGFSVKIEDDPVPMMTSGVSSTAETNPSTEAEGEDGQGNETPTTGSGPLLSLLPPSTPTPSISFFLFSFQVHEKTILVPSLPLMTLIVVGTPGSTESTTWELDMQTNNIAFFG